MCSQRLKLKQDDVSVEDHGKAKVPPWLLAHFFPPPSKIKITVLCIWQEMCVHIFSYSLEEILIQVPPVRMMNYRLYNAAEL